MRYLPFALETSCFTSLRHSARQLKKFLFPHPALKRIDCDGQVQPPSEITEAEEEESDEEAVVEEEETDEEYDDDDEEEEAEDPDNNEENDHDGEEEEVGEYGVEDNSAKEHLFERERPIVAR